MQEAMNLIDNHEYGNGTCIYTRDGEAARYFSDNIKVGMVELIFRFLYLLLIIVLVVGNVHYLVTYMRMVQMVPVSILDAKPLLNVGQVRMLEKAHNFLCRL